MGARTRRRRDKGPTGPHPKLLAASRLAEQGRFADAERAYREVVDASPDDAVALQLLALLLHRTGRPRDAVATLERAVEAAPDDATACNNLANMLREQGRGDAAVDAYRRALAADPGYVNAMFNLATLLRDRGEAREAIEWLRRTVDAAPDDANGWNELGSALLDAGEAGEARSCFERALALDAAHRQATLNAAIARWRLGELDDPVSALAAIVERWPDLAEARNNLGVALRESGRLDEARAHLEEAVRLRPRYVAAIYNLARVHVERADVRRAADLLRRCTELDPGHARAFSDLGAMLLALGEAEESARAQETAARLDPEFATAHVRLGRLHLDRGQMDAARECFERAAAIDPDQPELWYNLVRTRRFGAGDDADVARMESILADDSLNAVGRLSMHFALAKVHDDREEYDAAFRHYAEGNRIKRAGVDFDAAAHRDYVTRLTRAFDAAFFERVRGAGDPSELPVLVIGMPRSGTTLVEQILASHPAVHGAGEITRVPSLVGEMRRWLGRGDAFPGFADAVDAAALGRFAREYLDYLSGLAPGAARVTDKLPGNFMYLGVVAAALPRCRIVHCRRDAMDCCWSNFVQVYAEGHVYSYDLGELGAFYRDYERLMRHWRAVLPIAIHEVEYEAMIADQERVTHDLIDFCGLPWDDACLRYFENRRAVHTSSHLQVRQPIYRTSVGRWQRYREHLGALEAALGETRAGSDGGVVAS